MTPAGAGTVADALAGLFVRVRHVDGISYGRLEGETVGELSAAPWAGGASTGRHFARADVKMLVPCTPRKIFAVGRNYRSHLGTRPAPTQPELFWKPVSALQDPEEPIVLPAEATDVHFEGEVVLVLGQGGRNLSLLEARAAIFGVTCGNDVSERQWQSGPDKDLQWWRAKGADTFAPLGPAIATGVDIGALALSTRVNGEVVQQQTTADLLFDSATIVSYASRFVTLSPGDVFYTGTPGNTRALKPGDVVEVAIEGVGVLRNPVVAEGASG
jgi:2-keto-4-pentenoate hydratase/2-oxohepta-3-ene-1,7-dioic acid hydratase in catechol pathway